MNPYYLARLRVICLQMQRWTIIGIMNNHETNYSSSVEGTDVPYFLWALKYCVKYHSREWRTNQYELPYLVSAPHLNPLQAARKYFGLSKSETCALFMPGYTYEPFNLPALRENCTPGELAHQIHWFIVRKEQELKYYSGKPFDSVL